MKITTAEYITVLCMFIGLLTMSVALIWGAFLLHTVLGLFAIGVFILMIGLVFVDFAQWKKNEKSISI